MRMSEVIDRLSRMVSDLNAAPTKTRMRAILITDLQKLMAWARETLLVEGE